MSQRLVLKQKQSQTLSPQQIQYIRLLQIPTANLDDRISEEMEANPALEMGDQENDEYETQNFDEEMHYEKERGSDEAEEYNEDYGDNTSDFEDNYSNEGVYEFDEYIDNFIDDDPVSYKEYGESSNGDDEDRTIPVIFENTYHEYLLQQLGMLNLTDERQIAIAEQIIGSIDEDGYLRRDIMALIDDVMFAHNIYTNEQEVLQVLNIIHRFDPPGTGARNAQECLLLQLRAKLEQSDISVEDKKYIKYAYDILDKYFEEFSKKHYDKLRRQIGLEEEVLRSAIDEIKRLNPKPSIGFVSNSNNVQYIIPDFTIENRDGKLELDLHTRNKPELRISERYRDMFRTYKAARNNKNTRTDKRQQEAAIFARQKIEAAQWFIDAIDQRYQTMTKTMDAIMGYQYAYFLSGDQRKLKPMILKDIADLTGLDISTVSRVANSKFVQTEFGTQRLKDFFSESLQNSEGEEVSTLEVKKILKDIVEAENKRKPLSDEKLKSMLEKKGYGIARRTVAKYRELLNIPVARLRRLL